MYNFQMTPLEVHITSHSHQFHRCVFIFVHHHSQWVF